MVDIHKNNLSGDYRYKGKQYYAVTDKGVIFGSTPEIVQRKINRLGAGPVKYERSEKRAGEIEKLPF
jgi:hypothetical protein